MGGEPWSLEAKVYNVPDKLAQQIANQFTNVSLVVGYALPQPKTDASGAPTAVVPLPQGYKPGGSMLFSGDVVWYEKGREQNITDTFLTIYANSFDPAQNSSVVNTLLKAGASQKDVAQACVDAMALVPSLAGPAVTLGVLTAGMDDTKSPRSRTLYGMPKDILRDVAQTFGAFCHVDDQGKVEHRQAG